MSAVAPSPRQQIIRTLLARLREISPEHGYATDAGHRVSHGVPALTLDDPMPIIVFAPLGDVAVIGPGGAKDRKLRQVFRAEFLTLADKQDPLDIVEDGRADLQRALFHANDKTLGGLLTVNDGLEYAGDGELAREVGGGYVGCHVDCAATWVEPYGPSPNP